MPNYSLKTPAGIKNIQSNIVALPYLNELHKSEYDQLQSVATSVNKGKKTNVNSNNNQMILIGAALFTIKRIEAKSQKPAKAANALGITEGSTLIKSIKKIPQIQSVLEADDSKLVKGCALKAFAQWYYSKAYSITAKGERQAMSENILCGSSAPTNENRGDSLVFEPILEALTSHLPEVTEKHFAEMRKSLSVTSSGYSLEAPTPIETANSGSGWYPGKHLFKGVKGSVKIANNAATATGLNFWSAAPKTEAPKNENKAAAEEEESISALSN